MDIALLGYGTVGSSVYKTLMKRSQTHPNQETIKYVLTRQSTPEIPGVLLTHDIHEILRDEAITCVIEVMGGIEPAYTYVKQFLISGRSVITANKDLMAKHGPKLFDLAKQHQVSLLFDASVMGGTPAFAVLKAIARSNQIECLQGILNGTCNVILSQMEQKGSDYKEVLLEAQALGYAEADPTADVSGMDSARKLVLLASMASGQALTLESVLCRGIEAIILEDFSYAKACHATIRLIATMETHHQALTLTVEPKLIHQSHPLSAIMGPDNALCLQGDVVGTVMVSGPGAGGDATASAIVSDLVLLSQKHSQDQFSVKEVYQVYPREVKYVFVRVDKSVQYEQGRRIDIGDPKEVGYLIPFEQLEEDQAYIAVDEEVYAC